MNKNYSYRDVINYTSVDDINSSLRLMDPTTLKMLNNELAYLQRSLEYEPRYLNRISVIKILKAKIKKLELKRSRFING